MYKTVEEIITGIENGVTEFECENAVMMVLELGMTKYDSMIDLENGKIIVKEDK